MRIPGDELRRLAECVRDAWALAEEGRVTEGRAVLELGLTWAESPAYDPFTEEISAPEPWADELVLLYRIQLLRFCAAHATETRGRLSSLPRGSLVPSSIPAPGCPNAQHLQECREDAARLIAQSRELRARAKELRRASERARLVSRSAARDHARGG